MDAVYDLSTMPASFNFMEFLCAAKTYGATRILLDDSLGYSTKYSMEATAARMKNIVEPLCGLIDLPFVYGVRSGGEIDCGYNPSAPIKAFKECGRLEKLKSKTQGHAKYTVTIRNYERKTKRNSNVEAWIKFARDVGAVVIDDWYDEPISLEDRMTLYAGAEMNFGVNGGAFAICCFSDYPYMIWQKNLNLSYMADHGWGKGTQLPWATDKQNSIWSNDDSYENIMTVWQTLQ